MNGIGTHSSHTLTRATMVTGFGMSFKALNTITTSIEQRWVSDRVGVG